LITVSNIALSDEIRKSLFREELRKGFRAKIYSVIKCDEKGIRTGLNL
jgi:hypothetical protein